MQYTTEELREAARQIDSLLHKLRATCRTLEAKAEPQRYRSQITLDPGAGDRRRTDRRCRSRTVPGGRTRKLTKPAPKCYNVDACCPAVHRAGITGGSGGMVDALVLEASTFGVWVRVPSSAPNEKRHPKGCFFVWCNPPCDARWPLWREFPFASLTQMW